MEKTMKARVQHKHDIEANWLKATNFTPLASEIIVYDPDENYDYPRIKIGDGKTNINTLPFVTKDYAKEQWVQDLVNDSVTSLIVTYDTETKKASHTAAEIKEHYNLGRNVVFCANNKYLPIHLIFDSYVIFRDIVVAVNAIACYNYEVNDYGYVSESNDTIVSEVQSVNGKTGVVSLTASDVGALPSSTTVPTKTSQLTNDSGFINSYTETDPTVPAWAKAAAKPTYTASEVGALPDSTKIPSKLGDLDNDKQYITAAEVPDEIYVGDGTMPNTATIQFIMDASDEEALLKDELQEYINTEIEAAKTKLELDIPSKTSQLTNDSGFITAEDIPEVQVPDLSGYAKTSDIPTKTSQLTNDSGFITQHQSLSGYAKTSDIPTKVSQLTNDSGFITAKDVPEAQVPDLSGYALKSNAETWTFTLSNGSTVTKKVVLA